jgi:ornithine cyclodeaminase
LLERAELLVADDPAQAARVGELQHAPADVRDRARPLGELLADGVPGGTPAPARDGIAVADLTGLGAQDAAIATLVVERAAELGLGEPIALD